jgi:CRP-like cAMP-binding protein
MGAMPNHFVQKLNNLADLEAADTAAIVTLTSNPHHYHSKQDMIREGDEPGPVFVILKGWACRYKILPTGTRQIMAFLLPGDCCDLHVGMLAEMDHNLQALTPCEVALIPGQKMERLLEDHPAVAKAMYKSQLIDEGILRAWIVSMGRRTSVERVAHIMCELYLRTLSINSTDEVAFPISQIVLADALGMTPVHVNRILRELRIAGAMTLQRGNLSITDPVKLVQIAGFDENYLHRRKARTFSRELV